MQKRVDRGAVPLSAPSHLCNYQGFGALGDVCPACEAERIVPLPNWPWMIRASGYEGAIEPWRVEATARPVLLLRTRQEAEAVRDALNRVGSAPRGTPEDR